METRVGLRPENLLVALHFSAFALHNSPPLIQLPSLSRSRFDLIDSPATFRLISCLLTFSSRLVELNSAHRLSLGTATCQLPDLRLERAS